LEFGGTKKRLRPSHTIAIARDVIEIVAIIAAGAWAFYVFIYENRIKPSFAKPDINVTASIQRLGERNGMIAIGLRTDFHNVGTVKAHFLGMAVNVYGQRILRSKPDPRSEHTPLTYEYKGYYRVGPRVPVYTYAYVTRLGDPSTGQDTEIDPGTTISNYRAFYVPQGKFDLLTVGIDAPYTKYDEKTIPTHLSVGPKGDVAVVTKLSSIIEQYNIVPVSSLDIR
jgi:hypothetical protein